MRRTVERIALCFVDQVLALVREATLEELGELFAAGASGPALAAAPTPRARTRRRAGVARRPSPDAFEPELAGPAEEITDPGALLEGVAPVERESAPARASDPEPDPPLVPSAPESAERLVATTPATAAAPSLRAGEEIARASGAGIVIRRRKPERLGPRSAFPIAPDAPPSSVPAEDAPSDAVPAETLTEPGAPVQAVAVS